MAAVVNAAIIGWLKLRTERIAESFTLQPTAVNYRIALPFTLGVSVCALLLLIWVGRAWYSVFF
jgi:hypothetical protein